MDEKYYQLMQVEKDITEELDDLREKMLRTETIGEDLILLAEQKVEYKKLLDKLFEISGVMDEMEREARVKGIKV